MCASETRINTFQYCQIFTLTHTHTLVPVFKEYRFRLSQTHVRALSALNYMLAGVEHTSNLLKLTKTDRIHTYTTLIF